MDKLSYALGLQIGSQMIRGGIEKIDSFEDFNKGILTILEDTDLVIPQEDVNQELKKYYAELFRKHEEERKIAVAENLKKGEEFLKENAKKEGVKVTDSGLQYKVLQEGNIMEWPNPHSRVKVHYEGRFINGDVFDSSYKRGEPIEFGLNQVIPGWSEGVCLMKPGAKYEFYIPAKLAYGEQGFPDRIPGNSTLVFVVELLEILK